MTSAVSTTGPTPSGPGPRGHDGQFITTMSTTPADMRPARFLRIEKAVSLGDKNLMDGSRISIATSRSKSIGYMREILGYVRSKRTAPCASRCRQRGLPDLGARRERLAHPGFPQHRAGCSCAPVRS